MYNFLKFNQIKILSVSSDPLLALFFIVLIVMVIYLLNKNTQK